MSEGRILAWLREVAKKCVIAQMMVATFIIHTALMSTNVHVVITKE